MVRLDKINPAAFGPAVGYSHAVRVGGLVFIAGQIGGIPKGDGSWLVPPDFVGQFDKALQNVVTVLKEAGGKPDQIVEMVMFVKEMGAYRRARAALGPVWKRVMGGHYPAITMVEVTDLFEPGTLIEIRAVAALG